MATPSDSQAPLLKLDFNERCNNFPAWAEQALRTMPKNELWRYPDRTALECKIAAKFACQDNQVLVTNGADEAIQLLFSTMTSSSRIILPLPTFSMYEIGLKEWQLNALKIPASQKVRLDTDAILTAINKTPAATIILVRPNNPSGEAIALDTLTQMLVAAKAQNSQLVVDEAYVEFAADSAAALLKTFDNLLILRTFSKAYGLAGLRIGYMLGATAERLSPYRARCLPFNVNSISLYVAETALLAEAEQEVASYCQQIQNNRAQLEHQLRGYGLDVVPSEGNFLLVALNVLTKSLLLNLCQQEGIRLRQFDQAPLEDYVRITIPDDLTRLTSVLRLVFEPELICLDMDGVLIDTSQSYDLAIMQTVFEFSGQRIEPEQIIAKRMQGGFNNDWVLSQSLLNDLGFDIELATVTDCFQQIYLGDETKPGLIHSESAILEPELAAALKALPCSIVTGRPRAEAELGARLCDLGAIPIFSLDDVSEGKPNPEGINKAKALFEAKRVWMCGDNVDDIIAASNAQSVAIGIGKNSALERAGADLLLDNINRLLPLLRAANTDIK